MIIKEEIIIEVNMKKKLYNKNNKRIILILLKFDEIKTFGTSNEKITAIKKYLNLFIIYLALEYINHSLLLLLLIPPDESEEILIAIVLLLIPSDEFEGL